ncbi:MAG: polyhydroxyalkanoic acid system family protein [Proteobacteria bacterium]|nr:polyhydroxyalkanoic acid system family protein [Pseudomonadota bacterium]
MKIRRKHNLGAEEARHRADRIAEDLKDRFSLRAKWNGDALQVQGNGVSGRLVVDDRWLEVEVRLGFALMLMEGPIRSAIEATIDEELA